MERVPAELALLTLHQSGYTVAPATLRKWVQRGHITRGDGGYDLSEILTYVDRRRPTCSQKDPEQPHLGSSGLTQYSSRHSALTTSSLRTIQKTINEARIKNSIVPNAR